MGSRTRRGLYRLGWFAGQRWVCRRGCGLRMLCAILPTDPSAHHGKDQVFFGATVTYVDERGDERTVTIKGIDEADSLQGEVSWVSPIARTLLKSRTGDVLQLVTPQGVREIEVLEVTYPKPAI